MLRFQNPNGANRNGFLENKFREIRYGRQSAVVESAADLPS
jgi:hypothetical protein